MAAAAFEEFRKQFGDTVAISELSLEVPEGVIFGLLGPNGSGKTTSIHALCGLVRPTRGRVRVFGRDAHDERWRLRPRLGYMPQKAALYEDLTAAENLMFFARVHAVARPQERSAELLDLVGLADRAGDPVRSFSGGMKQRLSLACALVHAPPLLLLDEPTAGVDPLVRRRLWDAFRELRDQGATLVVSTNQLDEALHCDRLAILRAGRVLVHDDPRAVLARGVTRVTVRRDGRSETLALRDYEHELPGLLAGGDVESVRVEHDTLEDVMLRLVEEEAT